MGPPLCHSLCLSNPFSLSGVRLLIMQEDYLIYVCRRREGKLGLLGATGRMRKGAGGCAE